MRGTVTVIHLANLRSNIRAVKEAVRPGVRICMAVKADAYGHGAVAVARLAMEEGVSCLGVATVEEGAELRHAGIQCPILLQSPPVPEDLDEVVRARLTPFCGDQRLAEDLSQTGRLTNHIIPVHLKIDIGMGRIGCLPADAPALASMIRSLPGVELAGICTHFPAADGSEVDITKAQTESFRRCVAAIGVGSPRVLVHAANSGAILSAQETFFDMVRPGIICYGYYPSHDQRRRLGLRPVMELSTRIVFIKRVRAGTTISYGMTYRTARDTVIATLPVGYGDGYNRGLSNRAQVLIQGRRYPIVGRICMDHCMVDLGPQTAAGLHEEVTLFGPDPNGPDAEEIAGILGTIPYEVTCTVSKRVRRIYRA